MRLAGGLHAVPEHREKGFENGWENFDFLIYPSPPATQDPSVKCRPMSRKLIFFGLRRRSFDAGSVPPLYSICGEKVKLVPIVSAHQGPCWFGWALQSYHYYKNNFLESYLWTLIKLQKYLLGFKFELIVRSPVGHHQIYYRLEPLISVN